jgi:hypothetical protein
MFNIETFFEEDIETTQIIEEMYNRKVNVLNKLKGIIHPLYLEKFAKVLECSFFEELPEAQSLADLFNFNPIDFAAISEDTDRFKELFIKELEDNRNSYYA